jgi:hypothetical protein|tara:strand:+ start:906 stop:1082 length:177 start_codon:yes stop_codon:yes gene_type:complete
MIRYRIIEKQTVTEGMSEYEAAEMLMTLRDSDPKKLFDVEQYNWSTDGNRLGRDPDLH